MAADDLWSTLADFDERTFKNLVKRALETLVTRSSTQLQRLSLGWRPVAGKAAGSVRKVECTRDGFTL